MFNKQIRYCITLFFISFVQFSFGLTENEVANKLKKISPNIDASNIKSSKIDNLYEVQDGADVVYITKNGQYLIIGNIIDLDNQVNLTENLRKEARKKVLDAYPVSDMIVYKPKGTPKAVLTIFTDIDCGYCRKLHNERQDYLNNGYELRYIAFPRAGVGSESYKKAVTVWCSKDKNKSLTEAKLSKDFKIAAELCKNHPIDKSLVLVEKLGLNGTPAIVLEDGTMMPGYIPANALGPILAKNKSNQVKN